MGSVLSSLPSANSVSKFFKPVGNLASKATSAITSRSAGNFTNGVLSGFVGSRNQRRTVSTTTTYDGGLLGSRKTVTKRTGSLRPFSLSRLIGRSIGHEFRRSSQKPSLQNRILRKKNNVGNIELSNMSQESQQLQQPQPQPQPQQPQPQPQQQQQTAGNKKKPPKKETTPPKKETTPPKKEITPAKKETTPAKKEKKPPKKETNPPKKETNPPKKEKKSFKK